MTRIRGIEKKLAEQGEVSGRFAPATADPGHPGDPGVLHWTPEDGARLTIVGPTAGMWPTDVGGTGDTVHGVSFENEPLTLVGAWPSRITSMQTEITLRASTLLLDTLTTPQAKWRKLIIETARLHEWLPRTGLEETSRTHDKGYWTKKLQIGWSVPETTTVDIGTARMKIAPWMDSQIGHAPSASIDTGLNVVFEPRRARTADDLHDRYAIPFRALMMIAADRPDTVTREILHGAAPDERAVVQRAGEPIGPPAWRLGRDYLFTASDLPDLERSLRAWYRLWGRVGNAIAVFGDALAEGNSYSRARFLSVYTALEAYQRVILGGKGDGDKKLKALRDRGGIDAGITGATNRRLSLMVATRNWFSHLGNIPENISPELIVSEMFNTTRRATALMQGCLLRDLGIPKARRNELMQRHYRNWRIPA